MSRRILSVLMAVLTLLPAAALLPLSAEEETVIQDEIPFIEITSSNASSFGSSTSYSAKNVPEGALAGSLTALNRPVPYWTPSTPVQEPVEVVETLGIHYEPGRSSDLGVAFWLWLGDDKTRDALLTSSFGLMVQIGTTDSASGPSFIQQAAGKALAGLQTGWNEVVVKHNPAWTTGGTPDIGQGITWIKIRFESLGSTGLNFAINDIRLVRTSQTDTFSLSRPAEGGEIVIPKEEKVKKEVTDGEGLIVKSLSFITITRENADSFGSSSSASSDYLPEGKEGVSLTGFNRPVVYWAPMTPVQKPVDVSGLGVTFEKKKNSDLGIAAWFYIGSEESLRGLLDSDSGLFVEFGTDVTPNGDRWIQQAKMAALKDLTVGWNEIVIKQNAEWVSGDPDLEDGVRWIRFRLENLTSTGLNYALYDIRLVRTTQTTTFAVNGKIEKEDEGKEPITPGVPFDLTMQPGSDETEIGFNWTVWGEPAEPVLKLARAADREKGSDYVTYPAKAEKTGIARDGYELWAVKVTVSCLNHLTDYVSEIGDSTGTVPAFSFRTPSSSDFTALVLSDIHIIENLNWGRELSASGDNWRNSLAHYTDTLDFSLIVSLGDQMQDTTRLDYLNEFFTPAGLKNKPISIVNGNHDTSPESMNLRLFFNQANQMPDTAVSNIGDYYFRYGKALFVMLNISQDGTWDKYDHSAVFKAAAEAYPDYKWLIVGAHYPIYGPSSDVPDPSMQTITEAYSRVCGLLDEYHADLFLDGHTHVYARTHLIRGGEYADGAEKDVNTYTDAQGTVFITMGCATEMWELYVNEHSKNGEWIKTQLENTPTYQVLKAEGNKLIFEAYSLKDDSLIDTVTLVKSAIDENDGAGETAEPDWEPNAGAETKERQEESKETDPAEKPDAGTPWGLIAGIAAVVAAVGAVTAILVGKKKKTK